MKNRGTLPLFAVLVFATVILASGCFSSRSKSAYSSPARNNASQSTGTTTQTDSEWQVGTVIEGKASWYGKKFHGRKTANGEVFDMYGHSAAHKDMPLGSTVRITNLANDKSIELRVNDRGPYVGDRILDLSYAAAKELGYADQGVANVRAEILALGSGKTGGPPANGSMTEGQTPSDTGLIQVGTYSSRLGAERIYHFLRGRFSTIKVEQYTDGYRVLIGPFKSEKIRQRVLRRLDNEGYDIQLAN